MRGEVARFVPRAGAVVSTGWNDAAGGREASRRRPPEAGVGGYQARWGRAACCFWRVSWLAVEKRCAHRSDTQCM